MKTDKYQRRFYRDWIKPEGLCLTSIAVKETDLQILTNRPVEKNFLIERINKYRFDIENYISKDKRFLTSLKPIEVELGAPLIVKEMSRAAKLSEVGPMAAVAGGVAQLLGEDLLKSGLSEVIIENGGDIFLKALKKRKIEIYSGGSSLWKGLSISINPKDTPIGICTSSGKIGHSLSFGCADSVTILAKDAFLADAVATATCNRVKCKKDLMPALNFARSIKGSSGAIIIYKNNIASWGKSFKFVRKL